jgi:hypothetical protein
VLSNVETMINRRFIQVVVLLFLGAIVNVAVAWGCAIALDVHSGTKETAVHVIRSGRWDCMRWTCIGACQFSSVWNKMASAASPLEVQTRSLVPTWSRASLSPSSAFENSVENSDRSFTEVQLGDGRGWPWLSMQSEWSIVVDANQPVEAIRRGIELKTWPWRTSGGSTRKRMLPTEPIWPGFPINTIFYAAILWLLFFAPGALRRTIRRRRGLCPACAYPIGSSEICTECGKPVVARGS